MRRALVVAVTVGVLAGCATTEPAGAPEPLPIGEQPYSFTGALSPLSEFLTSGPVPDPAALAAEDLAREQAVQACMAGRGLTYVPVVHDAASYEGVDAQLPDLTRHEFAETYGFGISASPEGLTDGAYTTYLSATEDVNATAYEALDDAGKAAWDVALYGIGAADYGVFPEAPPVDGDVGVFGYVAGAPAEPAVEPTAAPAPAGEAHTADAPPTDEQRGCLDLSYDGFAGTEVVGVTQEEGEALEQGLTDLEQTILDDPRTIAATTDYTVCMRAAGYEVTGLLDAQSQASDRFYALTEDGSFSGSVAVEAMTEEELEALVDAAPTGPVEPDPTELAAVQAEEVAAALADLRCLTPSEPTLTAVRAELENAFLDAHRPELEAMRSSFGG